MQQRWRLDRAETPAFAGMTWLALLLSLLALALPAHAQNLPPRPQTPVLDQANLLRPEQVIDIETKAQTLFDQTGRTFFVAIVNSLDGLSIEDYGLQLGRAWRAGGEKEDDAVILIVAPKERKVRIETGYGAEGFLPDILAGRIIRDTIVPRFKAGDMGGGVTAGASEVVKAMSLPADQIRQQADVAAQQERARESGGINVVPLVFWGMVIAFVLLSLGRRGRGRRYRSRRSGISPWVVLWGLNELGRASRSHRGWSGGGGWGGGSWGGGGGFGGGSFGGFGGGFGGGGASGSW